MAHEELVDALPYIDAGYDDPGVKQTVIFKYYFKIQANTKC
jgi:hypothetical protein